MINMGLYILSMGLFNSTYIWYNSGRNPVGDDSFHCDWILNFGWFIPTMGCYIQKRRES